MGKFVYFFFLFCLLTQNIKANSNLSHFTDASLTRIYRVTLLISDQFYHIYYTRKKIGYYINSFEINKIGKIWTTNSCRDFLKLSIAVTDNQIFSIGWPLATNKFINKNGQMIIYWQRYKPGKSN